MRISVVHLLIRGAILPPARGVLRPLARKASRGGARRVPRPQGTVEEQWGVAGWNASSCDAFRRVLEHGERGRLGKAPGLCEAAREAHGVVVHVAVHSFTPVLEGRMREVDIGVLYDPARDAERRIAGAWVEALKRRTDLRVRRNQPYRGATDGLPTALRRALGEGYAGFELELSQGLWLPAKRWPRGLVETVSGTLRRATG